MVVRSKERVCFCLPIEQRDLSHSQAGVNNLRYRRPVRWERLFADAAAEWSELERRDLDDQVQVRVRRERKSVRLVDRLRMADGQWIDVRLVGAGVVGGVVAEIGPDWFLLRGSGATESLVPVPSVLTVTGLGERAAAPESEGPIVAKMTFRHAVTVASWDRSQVAVTLIDGSRLGGMVDRVGADAFDLVSRRMGEGRVALAGAVATVPLAAVAILTRR